LTPSSRAAAFRGATPGLRTVMRRFVPCTIRNELSRLTSRVERRPSVAAALYREAKVTRSPGADRLEVLQKTRPATCNCPPRATVGADK
jgi:hypothetical protein